MQQKKYSFNYLIFKHDFIKRRMLVNPATHPVGMAENKQKARGICALIQ
ncbi:Uncharacterised protein [Escherichia coli]|nr:Uncharacterised protein [Escherichia coli]SRB44133.1 Uncharacterised protein [Escherichia coli]